MAGRRCLLVAALVAACVDGPTSPGLAGELRFRPTYAAGDAPSALGLSVDSATVQVTRPANPASSLVDSTVAYASDTASLGWVLGLRAEEESLSVRVTIWNADVALYAGDRVLPVRDGVIGDPPADLPVTYVGPPIVATVSVSPDTVRLDALGDTVALEAVARDRRGDVVETAFAWASANVAVATVTADGSVVAVGNGATVVRAVTGGASDSTIVVVSQRVARLVVSPDTSTFTALGATRRLGATATDANGNPVTGASVSWASSDTMVATVDPATGTVTAVRGGTATVAARSGSATDTAVVIVDPVADVASIVVTPGGATVTSVGAMQQFTAVARDSAGRPLAGVKFSWSSTRTAVATVDPVTGIARAVADGSTAVTAMAGAIVGTATLTVNLRASIARIVVSPDVATLTAVGAEQQFTAEARDGNDAVVPVATFTWSTSDPAVATVDSATGLATATGGGSTTITAAVDGITGGAVMDVDLAATVTSVVVTPSTASLSALGATRQFTAEPRDANGAPVAGVSVLWSSSAAAVAVVDSSGGVATATGQGMATITATVGTVRGTATLTVDLTPSVASIVVSPSSATLAIVGATQQFVAEARDASGAVLPGVPMTWTSNVPAVATIDPAGGNATAVADGSTTISATANGVAGTALLTVDLTASIASVVVSPASVALTTLGATRQFTAEARDANGVVVPVAAFAWSSSNEAVATVGAATGLASATGAGAATIRATVGSVVGTASLSVDLTAAVASIVVTPSTSSLGAVGATQQFTAQARDAAGTVLPGVPVVWTSGLPAVATIDAGTGLATAAAQGATTIVAATNGVTGSASLTVDLSATIASVVVSPDTATLTALGETRQFSAEARDANGNLVPVAQFSWSIDDSGVASVDAATGIATAVANGTTVVHASAGSVSGTAKLEVAQRVARVLVSPDSATLGAIGATAQFTAQALDANGRAVTGVSFAWASSDDHVAQVDAGGLASAVGHGTATISATADGVSGSATLVVVSP